MLTLMRTTIIALAALAAACGNDKAKEGQVKQETTIDDSKAAAATPPATPAAATPPSATAPAGGDRAAQAKADIIAILAALEPVAKEQDECGSSKKIDLAPYEAAIAPLGPQRERLQAAMKDRALAAQLFEAFTAQDESELAEARSRTLGPLLHCDAARHWVQQQLGMPPM